MATFSIDDQEVEIVSGKNVLQTAIENDIHVPYYCYHPGLSAPANCRMCLVEIEVGGRKALAPSCTAMPAEGMVVDTQSELVKRNQNAVMEFLLINHPLDCPVCDQAGECELQNYSYSYGSDRSRFYEDKSVQPKKDIGEHVMLYSDRCIRCTRCIRFCDEVSGTSELGYFNRGVYNEVDIFPGERLDNRMSGNTIDICPVGALLDKEFMFRQRVWFLQSVDTICTGCSTGCNIRVDMNKDRIYRLRPRENEAVNEFWMCDDGRYGWDYVHSDDRLAFPLVGKDEEQLSLWEVAVDQVKMGFERVLEAHGEGSVAGIASGHLTHEEIYIFGKIFKDLLKGNVGIRDKRSAEGDVVFKSGFTIGGDKAPNTRGAKTVLEGLGISVVDAQEIWNGIGEGRIQALYVLGGDPFEKMSEAERKALEGIAFLVVQDILANDWTRAADVVLAGAAFVEKDGTLTNAQGRVQQLRKGLEPVGDARADWEILQDVSNALGGEMNFESSEDVLLNGLAGEVAVFEVTRGAEVGTQGLSIVPAE
ncbi:MAG: molybdopterin-dependent oxidoreductase [bacterium]|nr:molybdopterin-dependent oxidoreductase [bacterium]